MRKLPRHCRVLSMLVLLLVPTVTLAQDPFSFMPPSGPELLIEVLGVCDACDDIPTLAGMDLDAEAWRQYFEEKGALDGYSEDEVALLVSYLQINFPNARTTGANNLPRGGRSLAINTCQLCHSIALPMTVERPLETWLNHRNVFPHDSLLLSSKEWETIAHYLTSAAPIPLEDIPEQLRTGAGGY